jgi:hypothetical protein
MGDERAGQTHIRSNRRLRPASDAKILTIFGGNRSLRRTISAGAVLGVGRGFRDPARPTALGQGLHQIIPCSARSSKDSEERAITATTGKLEATKKLARD